jgi:hypothetical protein
MGPKFDLTSREEQIEGVLQQDSDVGHKRNEVAGDMKKQKTVQCM